MYVSVTKVGQGHPRLLLVQRLYRATKPPNMKSICNEPTPKLGTTLRPYMSELGNGKSCETSHSGASIPGHSAIRRSGQNRDEAAVGS